MNIDKDGAFMVAWGAGQGDSIGGNVRPCVARIFNAVLIVETIPCSMNSRKICSMLRMAVCRLVSSLTSLAALIIAFLASTSCSSAIA